MNMEVTLASMEVKFTQTRISHYALRELSFLSRKSGATGANPTRPNSHLAALTLMGTGSNGSKLMQTVRPFLYTYIYIYTHFNILISYGTTQHVI